MAPWRLLIMAALAGLLVASCDEGNPPRADGGGDGPALPDGSGSGETAGAAAVDFVVQGCAERTPDRCAGTVPLQLTFAALLEPSSQGNSASWDLGDGTKIKGELVVTHTYLTPGTYDVSLAVADAAGTVSELKIDFVEVRKAYAGAACDEDDDCVSGTCVCGPTASTGCAFPLDTGLCLESCELGCQDSGDTCVDLSLSKGEAWRTHLCLARCSATSDCLRPGFACAWAPGVQGWRQVCVPASLRFIGDPCRGGDGTPDPAVCVGGQCLDIGASGYCSWSCKAGTCPAGTRCAKLADGGAPVCLLRCAAGLCVDDPLLACELPGGGGGLGFEILGAQDPVGTRYCAVKRCKADQDCGLSGRCEQGFCHPG